MSLSDQGPANPIVKPINSATEDELSPKSQARLNLEQMILDALSTADGEMAKTIIAKGKLSFIMEQGTQAASHPSSEDAAASSERMESRPKLVSQEFTSAVYFGDKSDESTSLREAQRRETLSKFRPVHDPSQLSVSSVEQTSFGKVKISSNEYLDSLGRKEPKEAEGIEDLDQHDEDWALRESR